MKLSLKSFWNYYSRHLECLTLPFQAVFEDIGELENIERNKYRYHYLFDFFISAIILVDSGIVYLIYGNNPTDPTFQHHVWMRFMPIFFLIQGDIVFFSVFILTFFCYAWLYLYETFPHIDFILLYTPENQPSTQFVMPYRKSGLREITSGLAKKLASFHKVSKKQIKILVFFLTLEIHSAFTFPLVLDTLYRIYATSGQDIPSFRVLFCIISAPLYHRSLVSMIQGGAQFICQNHIIQIKQRHYLLGMNADKRLTGSSQKAVNEAKYKQAYYKWRKLMNKILDITREIEWFNRFYSRFITAEIVFYGFTGCSVLHAVATKFEEAPIIPVIPWVIYSCFVFFLFIFLFNSVSSLTIYLNVRMFKRLRQLQIRLLSGRCLNRMQIVKLDLVNEYKLLLQKCSFRLLNSAMINNKLFAFQVFGYISVFYLRLVAGRSQFH